jgi:hypothetical protein
MLNETQIVNKPSVDSVLEAVILEKDLSKLTPIERVIHYKNVCESIGLNPVTGPFDYLKLNGKTVLYLNSGGSNQLRSIRAIDIEITSREIHDGSYIVIARGIDKTGRRDESIGAVSIEGLKGELRANAIMKCETKAKRRVTLSICGLGMPDESEIASIPNATRVTFPEHNTVKQLNQTKKITPEIVEESQEDYFYQTEEKLAELVGLINKSKKPDETQKYIIENSECGDSLDDLGLKELEYWIAQLSKKLNK